MTAMELSMIALSVFSLSVSREFLLATSAAMLLKDSTREPISSPDAIGTVTL